MTPVKNPVGRPSVSATPEQGEYLLHAPSWGAEVIGWRDGKRRDSWRRHRKKAAPLEKKTRRNSTGISSQTRIG